MARRMIPRDLRVPALMVLAIGALYSLTLPALRAPQEVMQATRLKEWIDATKPEAKAKADAFAQCLSSDPCVGKIGQCAPSKADIRRSLYIEAACERIYCPRGGHLTDEGCVR
jgi:hypothetical protein